MNNSTGISGKNLIQGDEGKKLKAYPDSRGIPTIGIGSIYMPDGRRVVMGDTITEEEENTLFLKEIAEHDAQNNKVLKVTLPQNKYDAVSDFAFNEGIGQFMGSHLLVRINANPDDIEIPNEFMKWIYCGKNIVDGLVIRRGREIALWLDITLNEVAQKWTLLADILKKDHINS